MVPNTVANELSSGQDQQAYYAFYQQYAPRLWGVILLANLPVSHSEVILANVLVKAWQEQDSYPLTAPHVLSYLIGLSHKLGLPLERVQAVLRSRLKPFSR
ncbi:hypothetical protein [Fibrella forsythiae]|uniref:Uncharacterized protein n=1 Tax=Fibrella forsythiae TaxID=2817061 RepID=A0ABS3JSH1_9BACT|nr:hypothetical protein [Fibrella forsythiae]MBO0952954.1 hypothetical protein [Fibrella forsythiae]